MLSDWGTVCKLSAADASVEWENSSRPTANRDTYSTPVLPISLSAVLLNPMDIVQVQ